LEVLPSMAALILGSRTVFSGPARLKRTANRIYSRMQALGLNETELAERCGLAETPCLSRDRISKILMNRQEVPAKSAARVITPTELMVLASVLKVSIEWLIGQVENRDPVVWNVLAHPDRVKTFTHLLEEYEDGARQTTVWSQYPMYAFTSEDFNRAFNQIHYGRKEGIGNTRPLVQFYDSVARMRRKRILRANRTFDYVGIMFKSDFAHVICGEGPFSGISKTILLRNIQATIDNITNEALRLKLVLIEDDPMIAGERLRDFEILATVDDLFTVWNYHNGDVGWSENPVYIKAHQNILNLLLSKAPSSIKDTVAFVESLKNRLR